MKPLKLQLYSILLSSFGGKESTLEGDMFVPQYDFYLERHEICEMFSFRFSFPFSIRYKMNSIS